MATRSSLPPLAASDFSTAFPNSRKVYVDGRGVRVPMREIALGGGEAPLRVYDTSGPQGHDVRDGLPALRRDWIAGRGDVVDDARRFASIESPHAPALSPLLARRAERALRGSGAVTQ